MFKFGSGFLREEAGGEGSEGGSGGGAPAPIVSDRPAASESNPISSEPFSVSSIEGLTPEQKAIADKYQGDPKKLLDGYHNAQQLISRKGLDRAIFRPGEGASEEEISAYLNELGRPETPDLYEVAKPEGWPDDIPFMDDGEVDGIRGTFHKLGLSSDQAKGVLDYYFGQQMSGIKAFQEQAEANQAQVVVGLKEEWKGSYEKNLEAASRAARYFGIEKDDPVRNNPTVIRMLAKAASVIGETRIVAGTGETIQKGGAALANEIINNKAHPDHGRYWAGDQAVTQKVSNLFREG